MNDKLPWWQQESLNFLNDTLAFVNASRSRGEATGRCEELCKALNKTWNAFFQYRRNCGQLNAKELENEAKGQSTDNQSFPEFMAHGMSDQQAFELCGNESVRCFAELTPQIMNHATLLRKKYDPLNITENIRKDATDEHQRLLKTFERFSQTPNDLALKDSLLKKTAQMIYVVRSNIAHSEKTTQGPDLNKSERDRIVSEATARVIEDVFEILFDKPSQRLAVYGTLAPDGPNTSVLGGLDGQWHEGKVSGVVEKRDGFSEFYWTLPAEAVQVKVLSASQLKERFNRLDRFEAPRYRRILVPVLIDGKRCVSNIYQGNRHKVTQSDAVVSSNFHK